MREGKIKKKRKENLICSENKNFDFSVYKLIKIDFNMKKKINFSVTKSTLIDGKSQFWSRKGKLRERWDILLCCKINFNAKNWLWKGKTDFNIKKNLTKWSSQTQLNARIYIMHLGRDTFYLLDCHRDQYIHCHRFRNSFNLGWGVKRTATTNSLYIRCKSHKLKYHYSQKFKILRSSFNRIILYQVKIPLLKYKILRTIVF